MYAYIMQHYLAIKRNEMLMSDMMAYFCNFSTQGAEAVGLLQVPGQSGLHNECLGQPRQHRFCLKTGIGSPSVFVLLSLVNQ